MHLSRLIGIAVALQLLPLSAARAEPIGRPPVVVNEIFYNAPNDLTNLQWIEIHNTGNEPVDLGGWTLDEGKLYLFPAGSRIEARGYLVLAFDPQQFRKIYSLPALGPLKRPLGRGGGRLELRDAQQKPVDVARYRDREPWPVSADGYSASLERICPSAPGDLPANWAGSPLPAAAPQPAGTPGRPNASYSAVLPPVIGPVSATPDDLTPGQPLHVEAEVKGNASPSEVSLLYRTVTDGREGEETAVPMTRDAATGRYRASIPAQSAGVLIRYRVRAVGEAGVKRLYPTENDLRPALSAYVHEKWQPSKIAFGLILRIGADRPNPAEAEPVTQPSPGRPGGFRDFRAGEGEIRPPGGVNVVRGGAVPAPPPGAANGAPRGFGPGFFGGEEEPPRPPRGASAFVYVDPKSGKMTLFDYVNLLSRNRGPGWYRGYRIFFHKDRPLNGMSAVNLVLEGSEWSLLAEALAFDLYQRAGNAAPLTEFLRVWVDGRMDGYHLMVERVNRAFLRRNKLNDQGNLYKLLWYGDGLVGQHQKNTNPHTGHGDLLALVGLLRKSKGDEQWKVIQEHFNVNQVATYFAVNMVLSHWDGFFNNYFTYHDTQGTKKWEMYPWDQDKSWGFHDAIGEDEVFFDMPLTFGMAGAAPPGGGNQGFGGPFGGGAAWWRPPGHFSGPLLANPQFRKVFLARTKEILDRIYTKEVYFPLIDEMADRVREDVILRARARGEDAASGTRALARNVEMLKTHLLKRREFLLQQPELRALGDRNARG
jgi:hypothetical protein